MLRVLRENQNRIYVYIIKQIDGDKVIYVGKTSNPINRRSAHKKRFNNGEYDMFLIAKFYDIELAWKYEYILINEYFDKKHKLLNKHRYP